MSRKSPKTVQSAFSDIRADYDATRHSRFIRRRTGVLPMGTGPDFHFRTEIKYYDLIEQARDMDRNDALVGILADRRVDNIVQSGFTLDPATGDKGVNDTLKAWWNEFANDPDQCDIAGELTWKEIERQCCRSESIDGDIGVIGTDEGSFQMLESHLIRTMSKKDDTFLGVTTDHYGKHVQYHVAQELRPFGQMQDSQVIDVRNSDGFRQFFHIYNPKRVSMTRGVTQLAPVFSVSGMLEDINFAKLVQQQIVSCFAIFRKMAAGGNRLPSADGIYGDPSQELTATGTRQLEGVSPGMEIVGQPGEELQGFSPNVPNSEYFQQVKMMLQIIGVNFGLPLCLVLMDGSETNFSGWRGAVDEARKGFVADQQNLVRRLNRPAYIWKLSQYLNETRDAALKRAFAKMGETIFRHNWNLPTWSYIEPVADAQGDAEQLKNALTSPRRLHAARGKDWEDIVDESVEDNAYAIQNAAKQAAKINAAFPNSPQVSWRDLIALPMPAGTTMALQDPAAVAVQEDKTDAPPVKPVARKKKVAKAAGEWITTEDGNRLYLEDGTLKTGPGKDAVPTQKTNKTEIKKVATKDDAKQLLSQITQLRQSANRQINREFEGEDPGIDLPQHREADKLEKQMNNAGFAGHKGSVVSRDEVQKLRETFNKNVTDHAKKNPGKKIPSEKVKQWESEIGMSVGDLKALVSTLSLDEKKPQARSKKGPKAADDGEWRTTKEGGKIFIGPGGDPKFGGPQGPEVKEGGGDQSGTEDRRVKDRPTLGTQIKTEPTKIGQAKIQVSKSEDRTTDFGSNGKTVDDHVQMQVKIGTKVVHTTESGSVEDATKEAEEAFKKAKQNAALAGVTLPSKEFEEGGEKFQTEIYHDGFGGYHAALVQTDSEGVTRYHTDNAGTQFESRAGNAVSNPTEGKWSTPEKAEKALQTRARNLIKNEEKKRAKKQGGT